MQYLPIYFIVYLQENIYTEASETHYMSAGEAGRHVVDFLDLVIDVFQEVQDNRYRKYCI